MWLKAEFDEHEFAKVPRENANILVEIASKAVAPINDNHKTFRISPIFPLIKDVTSVKLEDTIISFFEYKNAYRILARIERLAPELAKTTFFSVGLTSVIVVTKEQQLLKELEKISEQKPLAVETWKVVKNRIIEIKFPVSREINTPAKKLNFPAYDTLPLSERAVVDEFCITIGLLYPKLWSQMPSEIEKIERLIDVIYSCIKELVYINDPIDTPPERLASYTLKDLRNPNEANIIKHQNLDRIVQINSALSYVSTQAFSGAIPIFERRSLIRRNSLLGIGSAMLALNNIARFIENCFSQVPFKDIITKSMTEAPPLKGLRKGVYEYAEWNKSSVNRYEKYHNPEQTYFKLPYFSGRLGYRETEYSIAAALQSISSGAGLEWSIMTVTHEMLHGHVRRLLGEIFLGNVNEKESIKRHVFYDRFYKKAKERLSDETLIDSIRFCIFGYCCFALTHGSITSEPSEDGEIVSFRVPSEENMWQAFGLEYRNINEIFVHVLDLYYFYAGRISVYIPLIWCSWAAVPHISGDIRQYLLRSLLTIAPTMKGDPHLRFNQSVDRLKEVLQNHKGEKLNHPVIEKAMEILSDESKLMKSYFPSFKGSLILVDMIYNVFLSQSVHKMIYKDRFVSYENNEEREGSFEKSFSYDLVGDFNDEVIESPLVYLLYKMIQYLRNEIKLEDLERETAIQFLALNSNS